MERLKVIALLAYMLLPVILMPESFFSGLVVLVQSIIGVGFCFVATAIVFAIIRFLTPLRDWDSDMPRYEGQRWWR